MEAIHFITFYWIELVGTSVEHNGSISVAEKTRKL